MSSTKTATARHRRSRSKQRVTVEAPSRPSFTGVLRNAEFRAVWLADAQSSLGDQLSRTALAVLVYQRTHSPFLTALIYAVTFLPALFSGVLLGGLADRFPHRSTLVRCNLARAGLVAAMVAPGLPIAALVLLVIASTLFAAPFDSANSAMLADVFEGEEYTVAASLRSMTHQVAQLLGFATGGLLLIVLTPRSALAIDALTFVIAAVLVRAAVHLRPAPLSHDEPEPYLASMIAGTKVVATTPKLRVLLGFAWLMGLFVIPEGLAAPYAASIHAGTLGVGLLLAAGPAGTALGSFLFIKLIPEPRRVRMIGVLASAGGLPLIACAFHPPLLLSLVLWALAGVSGAYLIQVMPEYVIATPKQRRGQAIGVAASGLLAVQGIGILLGGIVASLLSPASAIAIAGVLATVLAAGLSRRWRRVLAADATASIPAPEPVRCTNGRQIGGESDVRIPE
jgi:MFS family permease